MKIYRILTKLTLWTAGHKLPFCRGRRPRTSPMKPLEGQVHLGKGHGFFVLVLNEADAEGIERLLVARMRLIRRIE